MSNVIDFLAYRDQRMWERSVDDAIDEMNSNDLINLLKSIEHTRSMSKDYGDVTVTYTYDLEDPS